MRSISSRLNAWQRLAVVVTILWLVFGTHYFWSTQVDANYAFAASSRRLCESVGMGGEPGPVIAKCSADYYAAMNRYGDERWGMLGATFVFMLIAAVAFWIAAWIVFRVIRWVLAGRHVN